MAFDANKYITEYQKENYEQIKFSVYKGRRNDIKQAAAQAGVPMSKFITDALEKQYGLDLSKPKTDD